MNAPSTCTRSCSSGEAGSRSAAARAPRKARRHVRSSIGIAAPVLAVLLLPAIGAAQDGRGAPPGGRGAAPANYPPYTRPASTFAPPRTADGQPDIMGLYVAIPLPRGIETPLVPVQGRPSRANSEFSYSLNERPKLPEGAQVRPVGV